MSWMSQLFKIALLTLLISKSLAQDQKFFGTLVKSNPYMTTELLFGEKINLKSGDKIELLDFLDTKIKVIANGKVGYVWPDEFKIDSDFLEFKKYHAAKKQGESQSQINEELNQNIKFDSVKSSFGDSSIYIIRAKGKSISLYDRPNGKEITSLPKTELLKIRSIVSNEYFEVISLFNKNIKGYVIAHYCDVDEILNAKLAPNNSNQLSPPSNSITKPTTIYTGPRGGQYYINKNGKKIYIKKD